MWTLTRALTYATFFVGALLVLVPGAALYDGSAALSIYAIVFWFVTHCDVVFFEEPSLARTFGKEYEIHRSSVGRWIHRR
jgi:protein-S-isoprenylcysteine O-methyltransferase Ste14